MSLVFSILVSPIYWAGIILGVLFLPLYYGVLVGMALIQDALTVEKKD